MSIHYLHRFSVHLSGKIPQQRLVVRELLKQGLLPSNSVKSDTFTLDFSMLSSKHLDIISDIVQKKLYEDDDNDGKKSLASGTEIRLLIHFLDLKNYITKGNLPNSPDLINSITTLSSHLS